MMSNRHSPFVCVRANFEVEGGLVVSSRSYVGNEKLNFKDMKEALLELRSQCISCLPPLDTVSCYIS